MRALDTEDSRREDCTLIAEVLARPDSQEACRRLVAKYWRLLIAWVHPRTHDTSAAEDIVQETFIRAFRALDRLQDHRRFVPWLLRIAANRAADLARRSRRDRSLDSLLEDRPGQPLLVASNLGDDLEREEEYQAVLRAVDGLPDRYRLVIILRYFEGLSGSEIAAALGEPEGTIRNRLFRAHQKIRRVMEGAPAASCLPSKPPFKLGEGR